MNFIERNCSGFSATATRQFIAPVTQKRDVSEGNVAQLVVLSMGAQG
jgi:hypothetical protein